MAGGRGADAHASGAPAPTFLPSGVREVGLVAAALTAVWTVWFMVAFVPWIAGLPPWDGLDAFAASFRAGPYLAWAVPCLLLALTFPVFVLAVHRTVAPERRFWTGLGLLFAALYGGILGAVYWILVVVVPARIASGDLAGLAPLVVVSPHSTANALEYLGYLLMGLAAIFAGLGFVAGPRSSAIRALLLLNGAGGIAGGVAVLAGLTYVGMGGLVVWALTLPLACALFARGLLAANRPPGNPFARAA